MLFTKNTTDKTSIKVNAYKKDLTEYPFISAIIEPKAVKRNKMTDSVNPFLHLIKGSKIFSSQLGNRH